MTQYESIHENTARDKISVEALLTITYLHNNRKIKYNDYAKYVQYAKIMDEYIYSKIDKPVQCLPKKEIEKIFQKTNKDERMLLPKFYKYKSGLNVIRQLINGAVDDKNFCQLGIKRFVVEEQSYLLKLLNSIENE